MEYIVQPGDSLWRIAQRLCHDGSRWRDIARENRLADPDALLVGQALYINDAWLHGVPQAHAVGHAPGLLGPPRAGGWSPGLGPASTGQRTAQIPASYYVFVLADEIDPFRRKVVRRVLVNPQLAAELGKSLGRPLTLFPNPERFGFQPTGPGNQLSIGRHAMGMKPSPFLSASTRPWGATRFTGSPFWIDVEAARAAGASVHETGEILADLDRIAAKAATAADSERVRLIKQLVAADKEVLLKGPIPAQAVKSGTSMAITRGLQGVQVIGFAMSAVNMAHAGQESLQTGSAKPIAAETVRQVGGWAAAWAGMKLGAAGGALVGIETGPGALVTGAVGGVIGGVAGYFGFDWIADHIHEN